MVAISDRTNTLRSAREDQVALSELLVLGNISNHCRNIEDLLFDVRFLACLSIDLQFELNVSWVKHGAFVHKL